MKEVKLQKYPAYKDSGVEWLGEIPEHWEVKRIKFLFKIGRGRVISQQELIENGQYPVYSSQTLNNGVLGYINTYDFDCTQITWTTDGANAGTVFLRRSKHNCTNVCGTLQPNSNEQAIDFVKFALQVAAQFHKRPDTNGAKIMNGEMGEVFITIPPKEEQTAIANFLDNKTALIDKAIALKEKQIELLKERRQILIHRAITRGLNPNVKLKDSGVEWIGEIPEHWEVSVLGHYATVNNGSTPSRINLNYWKDGNIGWLSSSKVNEIVVNTPSEYITERAVTDCSLRIFPKSTIIMGIVGQGKTRGTTSILNIESTINQNMVGIIPNLNLNPKYLQNLLIQGYSYIRRGNGSNQEAMNCEIVKKIYILIPSLEEQTQIVSFLEQIESKISTAITLKEKEIEKLKEYKSVLINEAVSGKIKVG